MTRVSMAKKNRKFIIAGLIVVAVIVSCIAILVMGKPTAAYADGTIAKDPYSIRIDGKEVAVVNGKSTGDKVLKAVAESYLAKNAILKEVSYDKKISIKECELELFTEDVVVQTKKEATEAILKANEGDDPLFTVTTVSEKTVTKKTEQTITFQYDSSLSVFESKVKSKGKAGSKEVTYELTDENGKRKSKKKLSSKVISKPTNAIVLTGMKGMPENVKWSDYKTETAKMNAELGVNISKAGIRYLGNPYKLGGTDLYNGIDCVGFVRAMYSKYGITLPKGRTAIGHYGKSVSLSEAKAGDIVYYGNHVAIYMGNGKVIHAIRKGISISKVNFRKIVSIRRPY